MATNTLQAAPPPRQTHDTVPSEAESKAAAKVRTVAGTTEARIAEQDAKSERKLRERQAEVELRQREIEVKRDAREAKATAKDAKRTRSAERRRTKRDDRVQRFTAAVTRVHVFVAGNMPAVYSSGIYAMALYVAVTGQITMATDRGWPMVFGIGMAVFLEGLALSMALTAHQLRLKGERALVPVAATWAAAGFASAINFFAHRDDIIMASVLGASSLAAIIVWEVRSGAKHRQALRDMGFIPDPPERFGLRRWLRFPRSTWQAWSLDVHDRVSDGAAVLLARVETAAQNNAAATSALAAAAAQAAAVEASEAAAREAARSRAAAAEAHRVANRIGPKRSLFEFLKRTTKEAAADLVPAAAPKPAPAKKERAAKKPETVKAPAPSTNENEPNPFALVENAFVELYVSTGKRPGVRALEDAVKGAKKRSAIHTWTQKNAGRLDELTVRAESILAGRETTEVSA